MKNLSFFICLLCFVCGCETINAFSEGEMNMGDVMQLVKRERAVPAPEESESTFKRIERADRSIKERLW